METEDSNSKHDESSAEESNREKMARIYFENKNNLAGQRSWYSKNASKNKKYYQWLGLAIIAAGAGTGFVQIWAPPPPDAPDSVHWTVLLPLFSEL